MRKLVHDLWVWEFGWKFCLAIISLAMGVMSYITSQRSLFSIQSISLDSSFNLSEKSFIGKNAFSETRTFLTILSATLLIIVAVYIVGICLIGENPGKAQKKSPGKSNKTKGKSVQVTTQSRIFFDLADTIQMLLLLIVITTGWELALICSEVSTFSHQIFQQFSVQLLNFTPMMLSIHYASLLWWSIGFLLVPVVVLFIALHINSLRQGSLPNDRWDIDDNAISLWWKWDYALCMGLFILWETSPIFLGENSLNYHYIWTWDNSFSLWICAGIALSFIIAIVLAWRNCGRMVVICGFIVLLILLSWIKVLVCGIDWGQTNTIWGALSSIFLVVSMSLNCWFYPRYLASHLANHENMSTLAGKIAAC